MEKLSKSRKSKRYLKKSKTLPISVKKKIEEANELSNERIEHNNNVYKDSNSHSQTHPVLSLKKN